MWYEILVEKYSNNSQFNEQKARQIHKRTFACVLKRIVHVIRCHSGELKCEKSAARAMQRRCCKRQQKTREEKKKAQCADEVSAREKARTMEHS